MKPSLYFMVLFLVLACEERSQEPRDPEPQRPISFEKVNADVSDIELHPSFGFDIHVSGTFDYSENYYYSSNHGYDLTLPFYHALYEAGNFPIMNSKVHNSLMCRLSGCDSSQVTRSGIWQRSGVRPVRPGLVWKFATTDTENGYEVTMNDFPNEVKMVGGSKNLSTSADNIIEFEYNGTDSLLFGLLVIAKANLTKTTPPALISTQHHFPVSARDNRFIIPAELVEKVSVNSTDTTFINLISVKRVVKVIEGKKVAINYRKNHIYPTTIQ